MKFLFTADEAAAALGISRRMLDSIRDAGDIVPRQVGSRPMYPAEELERYTKSLPVYEKK